MTLNDETFAEASQALADRMLSAADTVEDQVAYGLLLATGRNGNDAEIEELAQLYTRTLQTLSQPTPGESVAPSPRTKVAMTNVA